MKTFIFRTLFITACCVFLLNCASYGAEKEMASWAVVK